MKDKDRLFELSEQLMQADRLTNILRKERDNLLMEVARLREINGRQEKLLDRAVQFRKTTPKKPKIVSNNELKET